jgi:hypothetical protein
VAFQIKFQTLGEIRWSLAVFGGLLLAVGWRQCKRLIAKSQKLAARGK